VIRLFEGNFLPYLGEVAQELPISRRLSCPRSPSDTKYFLDDRGLRKKELGKRLALVNLISVSSDIAPLHLRFKEKLLHLDVVDWVL
jgi:hypothetical protein